MLEPKDYLLVAHDLERHFTGPHYGGGDSPNATPTSLLGTML